MTSYQSRTQIRSQLQEMLPEQIAECEQCDALPSALQQLIMHNFQAKFVCYDKETNSIEVGVEEKEDINSYPDITVHKFKLEEAISYVIDTFRNTDQDLKFYGKLLAGNGAVNKIDDVVLV